MGVQSANEEGLVWARRLQEAVKAALRVDRRYLVRIPSMFDVACTTLVMHDTHELMLRARMAGEMYAARHPRRRVVCGPPPHVVARPRSC